MLTILRQMIGQAVGVVFGGIIVAAFTLAPAASANDEITVQSLQALVSDVGAASAQNKQIIYQGMLLGKDGRPVSDGVYPMRFLLYNGPTEQDSQLLWGQNADVNVANGMFTMPLDVTSDGKELDVLFTGQDLYLAIGVNGGPEAMPRQPLFYVPYAHYARNSDYFSGKDSKWLPLAYGVIDRETGGVVNGSGNFTSKWRDEADRKYYEILIDDEYYYLNDYVTIVTPISQEECPDPTLAHTNSEDGRLVIDLKDGNGALVRCKFHFVTYKL